MTQYTGWVVDVTPEPLGSALLEQLTYAQIEAGVTELALGDSVDFEEAGGTLDIGGSQLLYVSADLDADTVTLAEPLPLDLAEPASSIIDPDTGATIEDPGGLEAGTTVAVWDTTNNAPATVLTAYVRLGGEGEDDDPVPCLVAHALIPLLPTGVREGVGETVLIDDASGSWRVIDVQGKQAVLDGTVIDPTTLPPPGDSEPTEPPASSPAVEVHGTADSLVVEVTEEYAATSTLEFHLSLEPDFIPGPTTLAGTSPTAVYVVVIPPQAAIGAGDPAPETGEPARLQLGVTYYARVVARNSIGAAPPGPVTSGKLDPSTVTELVAARIVTGFTMTGAIQVGTHTWDPVNGLVIPQNNGGTINLPADGSIANIDAHVTARSMNVIKDWAIGGYGELAGDMQMMQGISKPKSPPTLTAVTLPLTVDQFFPGSTYAMAVDPSDDDGRASAWLLTKFSGNQWGLWGRLLNLAAQTATGIEAHTFAEAEVTKLGLNSGAFPYGIVFVSPTRFLMTTKSQVGGTVQNKVHSISFPGMVVENSMVINSTLQMTCYPASATSFGSCIVATTETANGYDLQVLRLTVAANGVLTALGGWSAPQAMAESGGHASGAVAYLDQEAGKYRVGITRQNDAVLRVWETSSATTPVLTRLTSNDTPMGTAAEGSIMTGGLGGPLRAQATLPGVFALDINGFLYPHPEIRGGSATNKANVAYTWFDANVTGGTHETEASPTASLTVPNGKWLRVSIPPAPEEEITDPSRTDKADRARIYASVAANALNLLQETGLGVHTVTSNYRFFVLGNQPPPTQNGFAAAGADPARIRSAAIDAALRPLIELLGTGAWRLGALAGDTAGTVTGAGRVQAGVSTYRATASSGAPGAILGKEATPTVWSNTILRGFTYSAGTWTCQAGAAGTYLVFAKATWAADTTLDWGCGLQVWRNDAQMGGINDIWPHLKLLTNSTGPVLLAPIEIAVGDRMQLSIWQNSGAAKTPNGVQFYLTPLLS